MNESFVDVFSALDLESWRERCFATSPQQLQRALSREGVGDLASFAALMSPLASEHLEELAARAHALTVQRFGRTLQMYAPLYVSNECIDTCTYCGFSRESDIHRVTLDAEAVRREASRLLEDGFRHVLLVSGEHPRIVSTGYLADMVRMLRKDFASVAIEVAPQSTGDYGILVKAGVDALVVYQETYHRETYAQVHRAGRKKNFDWRLATPERAAAAGMKRIGIGALLGLADPWFDALSTFAHAAWCQRRLWRSSITVSLPRLRSAAGAIEAPHRWSDRLLTQYVCALRLSLPDVGLVLSTRESAPLRDGLVRLGITQLSAGSRTEPGGYTEHDPQAEQFDVADHRSASEVAARLRAMGYDVVWKDWEALLHAGSA